MARVRSHPREHAPSDLRALFAITPDRDVGTHIIVHRRCDERVGIKVLERSCSDAQARFGIGCVKRRMPRDAMQWATVFRPPQCARYATTLTPLSSGSRDVRVLAVRHGAHIISDQARDAFLARARSVLLESHGVVSNSRTSDASLVRARKLLESHGAVNKSCTCEATLARAREMKLWKEPQRPLASPAHLVVRAFVETLFQCRWHPRGADSWLARILRERCGLGKLDAPGWLVRLDRVPLLY